MLKKKKFIKSYVITFLCVVFTHFFVLNFVKKDSGLNWSEVLSKKNQLSNKIKINNIELIDKETLELIRQAGIKGGRKNLQNPDVNEKPKGPSGPNLNFQNLGYNSLPQISKNNQNQQAPQAEAPMAKISTSSEHYFNYKKQKIIPQSREHNLIKTETLKNIGFEKINSKASNISNFDIRIERPEGVSEDQLNSDEKAFYSFYKRTYMNYISKLISTYDQIRVNRPGLDIDFEDQHILIAKIDYDENGNIVTTKILRSSESENVHAFFEEAIKKLNIPNPPKIFLRKQKQFSIYYQIHIN